jgi:hypothetical protein
VRITSLIDAPEPTLWGGDGRMYLFDTVVTAALWRLSPDLGETDPALLKATLQLTRALHSEGRDAEVALVDDVRAALLRHRVVVSAAWVSAAVRAYAEALRALDIVRVEEAV